MILLVNVFLLLEKTYRSVRFEIVGDDISEAKDHSVVRRILKRGEGWAKPSDCSLVDVTFKGIYENRVFDERTLKFTISEGLLQNIPEGFV